MATKLNFLFFSAQSGLNPKIIHKHGSTRVNRIYNVLGLVDVDFYSILNWFFGDQVQVKFTTVEKISTFFGWQVPF